MTAIPDSVGEAEEAAAVEVVAGDEDEARPEEGKVTNPTEAQLVVVSHRSSTLKGIKVAHRRAPQLKTQNPVKVLQGSDHLLSSATFWMSQMEHVRRTSRQSRQSCRGGWFHSTEINRIST
jgi:hypothetical protein